MILEFLNEWTREKNNNKYISKYKKIIPDVLINRSKDIQNLCINNIIKMGRGRKPILEHHLPYKDNNIFNNDDFTDLDLYELSYFERNMIRQNITKLNEYAEIMIYLATNFEYNELLDIIETPYNFLPPWIVYPLYNNDLNIWEENSTKQYVSLYMSFLSKIPEETAISYNAKYPFPSYLDKKLLSKLIE